MPYWVADINKTSENNLLSFMETLDYYKILEIKYTASESEIKQAYHSLMRKHHPDKVLVSEREAAHEKSSKIIEAYKILSNPMKRAEYDKTRLNRSETTTRFQSIPRPYFQNTFSSSFRPAFNMFSTSGEGKVDFEEDLKNLWNDRKGPF